MKHVVPLTAALLSGGAVVERAVEHPDWQIIPWTVMFGFWMLVWFIPQQTPKPGTIAHNTLPKRK